jgi:MFS family permease
MLTCALYIPLWFQAVRGDTAMQSGIQTIPLVLSVVVGAILSGAAVHRIGYYSPFMIAGSIMLCIGAGLLTTWRVWSRRTEWIGYQAILGLGVGFTMQHPNLAVQIALAKEDVPTATALLSLFQTLGGALFASVGQSLFLKHFVKGLQNIRGIPLSRVLKVGATELKNTIPEAYLHEALIAYNYALTKGPFLACLIVGCFTVPAALGMEWFSVKRKGQAGSSPTICSTDKESTNRSGKRSPSIQAVSKIAMESALSSTPPNDPQRSYIFRKSGEFRLTLIRKLNPDLKCDLEKSTDHY